MQAKRYRVRSESDPTRFYTIYETMEGLKCDCPAFAFRGACKHCRKVLEYKIKLLDAQIKAGKKPK